MMPRNAIVQCCRQSAASDTGIGWVSVAQQTDVLSERVAAIEVYKPAFGCGLADCRIAPVPLSFRHGKERATDAALGKNP